MGQHDSHLPRKDQNKGVSADVARKASQAQLRRLAEAQGSGNKKDAKNAKSRGR